MLEREGDAMRWVLPNAESQQRQDNNHIEVKNLKAILSFQEHLVREKGLPPRRLMLEHAASKISIYPDQTDLENEPNFF